MPVANPPQSHAAGCADHGACAIVIFAKAPVPGRCKTRLARQVGNRRAARIYTAMLEHAIATLARTTSNPIILACAPDTRHPLFARLARQYPIRRYRQSRGDLGTRMANGIRLGLRHAPRVVLIGSDQPRLDGSWLAQAYRALAQDDNGAWLAPTVDGGYWAIGLNRIAPRVFRGPRWSTPRVSTCTRTTLSRLALACAEPAPRNDIDTFRDWQHLDARLRIKLARRATMPGLNI